MDISYYFYRRAASPTHISKLIPALEFGEARMKELAKETGMTYATLTQSMQDAHKEGIIVRERINNNWEIELTEKGKALLELCKGLREVIENWKGEETIKALNGLKFGEVKEKKTETKSEDVIKKVGD